VAAEKLYFALEMRQEGKLVGRPKLLGETGKVLKVERRQLGAVEPDYQLILTPQAAVDDRQVDAFNIRLEIALPKTRAKSELSLLHGQERQLELGNSPGALEVKLLLMKVDSPEFRALMSLSGTPRKRAI
jgi:hypothetical protein